MPNSQCRKILGQLEIRSIRNSPHQRGQGLLEAVVALGIIVTGAVAALTLGVASLTAGVASESRIIAANLARESIEVVRNIRDSNWISIPSRDWNVGLDGLPKSYTLTWDETGKRMKLLPITVEQLNQEHFRVYRSPIGIAVAEAEGNSRTRFFRGITLSDICKGGVTTPCVRIGIRVQSGVGWEHRGVTPARPQVEVIADLYKWR